MGDEDSDGELNSWELSERMPRCLPKERAADLLNEDWDLELKADQGNPYGRCGVSGVLGQGLRCSYQVTPKGRQDLEERPTAVSLAVIYYRSAISVTAASSY